MAVPDQQDVTRVFRALSVEKRVEIVRLLGERALCVGALSHLLGISAGAVSQHLRILRDAGIAKPDRRGYFTHYSLAPEASGRCLEIMDSLFGKKTEKKEGSSTCVTKKPGARSQRS